MPKMMYNDEEVGGSYQGVEVKDITQAEYNALSDIEKNKSILYNITDVPASLIEAKNVSYNNSNVETALNNKADSTNAKLYGVTSFTPIIGQGYFARFNGGNLELRNSVSPSNIQLNSDSINIYDTDASNPTVRISKDGNGRFNKDVITKDSDGNDVSLNTLNQNLIELKILGWNVPSECPIQNTISGNSFIQKVGRVNLGSLTWTRHKFGDIYDFYVNISDRASYGTCYQTKYTVNNVGAESLGEDEITYTGSSTYIYIRDDSYTDASTFKTAMSGVYLYYQLATPITHTIDESAVTKLNDSLTWKLVGKVTGQTSLALPSNYNEILVVMYTDEYFTFAIPKVLLDATNVKIFRSGAYYGTSTNYGCAIYAKTTSVMPMSYYKNGSSLISTVAMEVYYR